MNQQFENYIETLNEGLRNLPVTEREAEIAELRQHLNALVQARAELGNTETNEDAVLAATKQFGEASVVRRRLVLAYHRRQLAKFRQGWIGAVISAVCAFYLVDGLSVALDFFIPWEAKDNLPFLLWCICGKMFLVCWLFGSLSARFSGSRCLPIIALWTAFSFCTKIAPQLPQLWLESMPLTIKIHTLAVDAMFVVLPLLSAFIALRQSTKFRKA